MTCHHEFDECVRGVWLTPLAFWPFTQRKDFQMDGRSVNIKREERSLAWRSHSSSCDHVIMSNVYWNYVPHHSLDGVWMIFSFTVYYVCVCVYACVYLTAFDYIFSMFQNGLIQYSVRSLSKFLYTNYWKLYLFFFLNFFYCFKWEETYDFLFRIQKNYLKFD